VTTGEPYLFTGDDPLNSTDPMGLAKRPPRLSQQERQALERAAKGLSVNKKILNQAKKKVVTQGKLQGTRNVQKRQSNFVETPVPSLVMAHPHSPTQDPWAFKLPETDVNQPSVHLWLPGTTITRDLGISGVGATILGGAINAVAGTLEVGGGAAAG
jgi:hypothetical protein